MTTRQQMAMACACQKQVILALRDIGETGLADRVDSCMASRRNRHSGDGWPRLCQSVACVWCRRPLIRAWWAGICDWAASESMVSLALIPLHRSVPLPTAVRRLRRGLRDVRDRMARRRRRWRKLAFAGMAGGDRTVLVVISHAGLDRREVLDVLRRRWSGIVLTNLGQQEPVVAMTVEDAADLGRCRRGAEPLRIVVLPQRQDWLPAMEPIREPMPVVV